MPILPAPMSITAPIPYTVANKAAACAASDTVAITPGDMLQMLDDFRAGLNKTDRARLDQALPRDTHDDIVACDGNVDRSEASCENGAYFHALRRTGMMARFKAGICPKPTTRRPTNDRSPPHTATQRP